MPELLCTVTAIHLDGTRHSAQITAKSVNWAAIKYLSESLSNFPGRSYPKTDAGTVFEVACAKGTFRIGQTKLLQWANREAEKGLKNRG